MSEKKDIKDLSYVINSLEERAKELNCLFKVEEILNRQNAELGNILTDIAEALPPGWQFPTYCSAKIVYQGEIYTSHNFKETKWVLRQNLIVQDEIVGSIEVYYSVELPKSFEGPFLQEERKLIDTISERLSHYLLYRKLKDVFEQLKSDKTKLSEHTVSEWRVVIDLLRKTDKHIFTIISRKMLNHLLCRGIIDSKELFLRIGAFGSDINMPIESNTPTKKQIMEDSFTFGQNIFETASKVMKEKDILSLIQKWINEEKAHTLVKALSSTNATLSDISDSIRKYYNLGAQVIDKDSPVRKGILVSLIRRFLTDQLEFINVAKEVCRIRDFHELLNNLIYLPDSHGKLGGKSAGLFLAKKILDNSDEYSGITASIKIPKTWYITSDTLMNFVYYNNLEDVIEQKYKDIEEIKQEYNFLIQAFKNSRFPNDIINGFSRALDDFGDSPIIVRSSSLLEDRMGSAFAGKYKSLFLANQGTKQQNLDALSDAVAEVYASVFSPDPISYRTEMGLLDFNEEMGIMIQEVVGTKIGKYFFPAFAGVAFSNNEFRWSPRIKREDGLVRLVPGLGTRAVDRIGDEFPILVSPGQPSFRVNLKHDEIVAYSPKNLDVINLDNNCFETVSTDEIIKETGNQFPMINDVFSILEDNHLRKPVGLGINTKKDKLIVTFENLISNTPFLRKIHAILSILKNKLNTPVDIEFASDGKELYLLQCRPQSSTLENFAAVIPQNLPKDKILFTANKYVSNGKVPDIYKVVYVDSAAYSSLSSYEEFLEVGKTIGKLNKILPPKKFILIGPGRWGSRGDISLGVPVSYTDINNTAVLIEVARKKGNYIPDLSFGTHFFQDLVESGIRYLPLYPDDKGVIFKEKFFHESENRLGILLPESKHLEKIIKVVNIPDSTGGLILRLLMNADEDRAVAFLDEPKGKTFYKSGEILHTNKDFIEHWLERMNMAVSIANNLDPKKFGVDEMYVFGSTYSHRATASSDIDILIVFSGTEKQKNDLKFWLNGWDKALIEILAEKTAIRLVKLLDIHIVDAASVNNSTYYDIIKPENKKSKKLTLMQHD